MAGKRLIKVHDGLYRTESGATSVMRWTFGPEGVGPWVVRWRSMIGGQEERSFDSFGEAKSFVFQGGVPEKNLRTR